VLAALCCVQALLVACALVFAQVAVDRAASGAPDARTLASMPAGWRDTATVERRGTSVVVRVAAPAVLPGASKWLDIAARAEVRP